MDKFTPSYLDRWTLPDSYSGAEWPDYYVSVGQHRDSDSLTRSNFMCTLEALGGESETVLVVRERHWAVGWVEWIAIHEDDERALRIADQIEKDLRDYPVVNEDHWSELEYTEACDSWSSMSLCERVSWCRDCGASVFAARRSDEIPEAVYDRLREA